MEGGQEAEPQLVENTTDQNKKKETSAAESDLEGLDSNIVVEIIDRMGSSDEEDVEYLLQCVDNRQQWVRKDKWLEKYPECQPMVDIYELCRASEKKKRQIKQGIRSRAESRREDTITPSSSDEGQGSDTFDSPNRRQKRRRRRERREARDRERAAKETTATAESPEGAAPALDLPSSSMDLNPRSPPKRVIEEAPPVRRTKLIKVDEMERKHKQIVASFTPGKNGKSFYTKGQYDCAFDMITFSALIDRNQPERIFNHRINIIGRAPTNRDFLIVILMPSRDIANEMVEAIFPDMTIALSRDTLEAYAPKALSHYEHIERMQQRANQ